MSLDLGGGALEEWDGELTDEELDEAEREAIVWESEEGLREAAK